MFDDPIAALATPPGRSALAVVRLSGRGAFDVAARVVDGLTNIPARRATLATFRASDGAAIDRGVCTTYPGPGSYTGEDMVELSCHGGLVVPARLLAALQEAGARPARPGEFTFRAVLHGKLDLVQAEGVSDLIDATAPAQARSALSQMEGGLSRRLEGLRDRVLDLLAMLGYALDFPEEDDGPVPPERVLAALDAVSSEVAHLLATAPAGERLREGALVVFAGRPNAGKSSLFNALLGAERALVTEIPGTTRDAIEAAADVEGWPVRLIDTAGLWDAPATLDRLGVEVSRRYLGAADLVLLCVEAGRVLGEDERAVLEGSDVLLVRTKSDLLDAPAGDGVPVSIVSGAGLDQLRQSLAEWLFGWTGTGVDFEPVLTRERHRVALRRAAGALDQARPQLGRGGDAVLAAHHVRDAVATLDQLIGVVDPEDVLTRIFARFCVGK